jgi:ABC-type multidrug transport system ATPase subunit/ABC-type transport system involved in multi-copper enzyme maturation permease subunit
MIEVREVSKSFGRRRVLDGVSLGVRSGRITLLLGPNGAGKSTLLRAMLGIEPYDGEIRVDGFDPTAEGRDVRARIGYLPQHGGLAPDLTVAETLAFFAALRGVPAERCGAMLAEADLCGHETARAGELSGGLRQRLGFAVALLGQPPILVLDEPSASLDVASRQWLAGRLRRLADGGRTVLVSTHACQELFDVADDRITIADGRVVSIEQREASEPSAAAAVSSTAVAATPARAMLTLLKKELRDAGHNRWLIGCAALIAVLGLAATAAGSDEITGPSVATFGRTSATLLNLSLLLAPLLAVLMGASSITGERERGTLELLLAQPLTRSHLLLAKHGGLLVAITAATCAGFLPAGLMIAAAAGPGPLASFVMFPLLASACAAAMAGLGLLVSVTSRSAVQAQGTAVGIWFTFALLYDLVLIGVLAASGLPAGWLAATLLANPVDAARVLGVLALEPDLYLLGPAGAYLATRLSSGGTALLLSAVLLLWMALPVAAALVTFSFPSKRTRHETNWIRSRRGHLRSGNRPGVQVERARI